MREHGHALRTDFPVPASEILLARWPRDESRAGAASCCSDAATCEPRYACGIRHELGGSMNAAQPGPLVSAEWLAAHLGDADLRLVHVSLDRKAYDHGHVPGAVFVDLHVDLAKGGTRPRDRLGQAAVPGPHPRGRGRGAGAWGVAPGEPDRLLRRRRPGSPRHPGLLAAAPVRVPDRAAPRARRRPDRLAGGGPTRRPPMPSSPARVEATEPLGSGTTR